MEHEMEKVNTMNEVQDRRRGGNDLGEAIENG
jgi:hypothetical protein